MKFCPIALKYWRETRCLTIKHLSKKCGVPTDKLEAYEANEIQPTAKVINRIASALGIEPLMLTDVARRHNYQNTELITGSMAGLIYLGRIQKGWSRNKLANESKCPESVIAAAESGKTLIPRWENIWKVADTLGIPREKVAFS